LLAAAGCNALNGVGDLEIADVAPVVVEAGVPEAAAPVPDAGQEAAVDAGDPCPANQTLCGGTCVALNVDDANCGACGKACGPGFSCAGSVCLQSCPGGVVCPNGAGTVCVDPKKDPAHCGSCTKECGAGESCVNGACAAKLTVTVNRPGNVNATVTSNVGGISCPGTCSADVPVGTTVTLTSTTAVAETLVEWTGACAGRDPTCSVKVDAAKSVVATFAPLASFMVSSTSAYAISPTGTIGPAADLKNCGNPVQDLAVNRKGNAYAVLRSGVSQCQLRAFDLTLMTCANVPIGTISGIVTALAFAPNPDDVTQDRLYAVVMPAFGYIDTTTGSFNTIAMLDNTITGVGDLAWVPGKGLFAAYSNVGGPADRLGKIDPKTGAFTAIGAVGEGGINGLGRAGSNLLACSFGGILSIDTTTGAGTVLNANQAFTCLGGGSYP
jgi:hypothetical protein